MDDHKTSKIVINTNDDSLQHEDHPYKLYFNTDNFMDDRAYLNFIKNCERSIRHSMEYREWVSYLKESVGISECQISNETYDDCSIDIHHHPFTLFQLVEIAISDFLSKGETFSTFDISKEIMLWHFRDIVGYIPLVRTLHEKYHNGKLQIPTSMVNGDWKKILEEKEVPEDIQMTIHLMSQHAKLQGVSAIWDNGVLTEGSE